MKLTFFGAAHAVTGSCHCLEVGGKKILIDCGLQQGRDEHDDNALDFAPNDDTDPAFGQALRQAARAGVEIAAYSCRVTPGSIEMDRPVPVLL